MIHHQSRTFTVLLGALAMAPSVSVDMSLPALPTLVAVFSTTPETVQLTLSLFILGYAVGQLLYGPLSDRFGRRPILLIGLSGYALCSLACVLAPRIEVMVVLRLVQGIGACVGVVLGRAVVRDHFSGVRAAHMLSTVSSVMAIAPLVAPVIGGFLLVHLGWPAIFLFLGGLGVILLAATWIGFAESLTRRDPQAIRPARLLANYTTFFSNRRCVGLAFINSLAFAGLFAFISGSPFVLIEAYGVPRELYGFYFGSSALGLMAGVLANRQLLRSVPSERLLQWGLGLLLTAGAVSLALAWTGWGGALGIILPFVAYVFAIAMVLPNATAAAMEPLPHMAGTGASLMGAIQMASGSLAGYAVNRFYDGTARSMGVTMALAALGACALYYLLVRQRVAVA